MASSSSNYVNEGSHPSVASFSSIKLSGNSNYEPWKAQMWGLVKSHGMLGYIDGTVNEPQMTTGSKKKMVNFEAKHGEWKRLNTMVTGWIIGSLSEDVKGTVVGLKTANDVWEKLNENYATKDFDKYIPLCRAIEMGNWEKAQEFFNDKRTLTDKLNNTGDTALDIAIRNHANISFLENLFNLIDGDSLLTSPNVLGYAVAWGNKVAVEKLVLKNPYLLFYDNGEHDLPLHVAAAFSYKTIFDYLFEECKHYIGIPIYYERTVCDQRYSDPFKGEFACLLLRNTISAGFFDIACDLIKELPELATTNGPDLKDTLHALAEKWDAYPSAKQYNFYQRFVYSHVPAKNYSDRGNIPDIENQETRWANPITWKSNIYAVMERTYVKFGKVALQRVPHIKHLYEDKVKHHKALTILKYVSEKAGKSESCGAEEYQNAVILAVENNIPEVIEHITRWFPQLIWNLYDNHYSLYQLSIMNRCEKAYNFLVHNEAYHKYVHRDMCYDDDNLLNLAGKLAPQGKLNMVSGAALQMQRELQWFQEVRNLVPTKYWEAKNTEKKTPSMVFVEEHEDLRQKGEDWMKKTADSYTITAALIITIVFAAAITVPGGNNEHGEANYKTRMSFFVFIVADAISLFTSTTSLLLFLSILTARYAVEDFLYKLPTRLILGLIMLFLSVTTMLIAFGATLYIMSGQENTWILIPIAAITCLPIASFVTLQLPLLVDLISSTYGNGIFGKRNKLKITS